MKVMEANAPWLQRFRWTWRCNHGHHDWIAGPIRVCWRCGAEHWNDRYVMENYMAYIKKQIARHEKRMH